MQIIEFTFSLWCLHFLSSITSKINFSAEKRYKGYNIKKKKKKI